MHKPVDRYLKDRDMDHIDHALGRPVDPMAETYRNYFATDADGATAKEFDASAYWVKGQNERPGRTSYYYVTDEGRAALARHLKEIGDRNRVFSVTYGGNTVPVVATSAAKAKYRLWLDISDSFNELTFGEFCRDARSVRGPSRKEAKSDA